MVLIWTYLIILGVLASGNTAQEEITKNISSEVKVPPLSQAQDYKNDANITTTNSEDIFKENKSISNDCVDDKSFFIDNEQTNKTLKTVYPIQNFIDKGMRQLQLINENKTIIVLGNTGSGISTLVHYIATDNSLLESQKLDNDTDNYIIVDTNKKINNGIVSHTVYPEQINDTSTNTSFYDFPGFQDDLVQDISIPYFMKQIVADAKSIKLVFVIEHESMRTSGNRNGFRQLATHVTTMISDINKYENGIAIIVSKVKSNDTDEKIKNKIAKFLEEFKETYKDLNINIIKFIDILLTKNDGIYQKIGLIKQPRGPGKLSDMEDMKNNRLNLKTLIDKNIKFVLSNANDFNFIISESLKLSLLDALKKTNDILVTYSNKHKKELQNYFSKKFNNFNDIEFLYNESKSDYEQILQIKQKFEKIQNTAECVNEIYNTFKTINKINLKQKSPIICNDTIQKINNYRNYLDFIKKINITPTQHLFNCKDILLDLIENLNDSQKWYSFIIDLYNKLSKYDVQKNISQWKLYDNTVDLDIENKTIENTSLLKFLNSVIQKLDHSSIKNVIIDKIKLNHLINVLDFTLNHKPKMSCSESNKLEIKGNYVKISDIIDEECPEPINTIEIIALDTIFIDKNFTPNSFFKNEAQMSIIAPKWNIVGHHQITLDGKAAETHKKTKADDGLQGKHGMNGTKGFSGGSAGMFFGIGNIFENSEFLTINAIGGSGSPGQDGGSGSSGRNGENPRHHDIHFNDVIAQCFSYGGKWNKFDCKRNNETCKSSRFTGKSCKSSYTIYGTTAENGMNGGNGGCGGNGGRPGTVSIINIQNETSPNFIKNTKQGTVGVCGKGGIGGNGGKHGWILNLGYEIKFKNAKFELLDEYDANYIPIDKPSTLSGVNGTCPKCSHLELKPQQFNNTHQLIENYQKYLNEIVVDSIKQESLKEFDSLLKNYKISKVTSNINL